MARKALHYLLTICFLIITSLQENYSLSKDIDEFDLDDDYWEKEWKRFEEDFEKMRKESKKWQDEFDDDYWKKEKKKFQEEFEKMRNESEKWQDDEFDKKRKELEEKMKKEWEWKKDQAERKKKQAEREKEQSEKEKDRKEAQKEREKELRDDVSKHADLAAGAIVAIIVAVFLAVVVIPGTTALIVYHVVKSENSKSLALRNQQAHDAPPAQDQPLQPTAPNEASQNQPPTQDTSQDQPPAQSNSLENALLALRHN